MRIWAGIVSALFFLLAPGTIAGLIPFGISGWQMQPPFLGWAWLQWLGVALIAIGAAIVVESFARFVIKGFGTPAPVAPPTRLVVSGFYRHTRNPMYVGVTAAVVGQALLLGDVRLLWYAATVWLAFHLFVLAYEEPALRLAFGDEYTRFCANVPRWLPRIRPWRAGETSGKA